MTSIGNDETDYNFDHSSAEGKNIVRPRILSVFQHRDMFNTYAVRDYLYLKTLPIKCSPEVIPLLLPQSVAGRAQNGHGMFIDESGRPLLFRDASIDHAVTAIGSGELGIRDIDIRHKRQAVLTRLSSLMDTIAQNENFRFPDNHHDQLNPLGISFLFNLEIDSMEFIKGFIMSGLMDNFEYREKAVELFKVNLRGEPLFLGGGINMIVDSVKFQQVGLTEDAVSDNVLKDEEIEHLRELGVIRGIADPGPAQTQANVYFRRAIGPGVSDDAAMIFLGKTYGVSAMAGAFLADAVDTYDKYVYNYAECGTDEDIAFRLKKQLGDKVSIDDKEIMRLIYFSAKSNYPSTEVSSSHRRLIQVEPGAKWTTFENHVAYVQGQKYYTIPLGYNRYDSDKFYGEISERAKILKLGW